MPNSISCFHCGASGGIAKFTDKRMLEFTRFEGKVIEYVNFFKCTTCEKESWLPLSLSGGESQKTNTLHLNLIREWFDMIASGKKKEEYRIIKEHWIKQVFTILYEKFSKKTFPFEELANDLKNLREEKHSSMEELLYYYGIENIKHYDTITFRNGFNKNSPELVVELNRMDFCGGRESWGAEKGEIYFTFRLGNIISKKNI